VIFGSVQVVLFSLFYLAIFVLCVWALIDAARRPAAAYVAAGKRTKQLWLIVLGVATAVSFIALPPLGALRFLALIAAVAAVVYLVDVKPAIGGYSGGGRRGGPSRGGW
jgi:hypothetical protein